MNNFKVPLIIRGEIIEDYEIEYADRNGGMRFKTPDVKKYVSRLVNDNPISLLDMYEISLDDIVDFLDAVGKRLDLDTNSHWREAFDVSCLTSNLSRSVLETAYRGCTSLLSRDRILERVEAQGGIRPDGGAGGDELFGCVHLGLTAADQVVGLLDGLKRADSAGRVRRIASRLEAAVRRPGDRKVVGVCEPGHVNYRMIEISAGEVADLPGELRHGHILAG